MRLLRRIGSPVAWGATALFVALMVLWTIVTPAFRNPDEPQHTNSVLRLAEGGGWPAPAEAFMDPGVLRAKTLSGFSAVDGQSGNWAGGTLLPGVRPTIPPEQMMYFALFSGQQPRPVEERKPFDELELTQPVALSRHGDQMTQHPPLYYAINAGVVKATGALDWRFDRAFALMRLVSVAMVAPLPLLAFSVVTRLTNRRRLGDVAAVLPIGIPQLTASGASVTNDALVILLGGVLTLLLTRMFTGDRSWRTVVGTGVVLGLALFTKGTMLAAVPVAGLAVVLAVRWGWKLPWSAVLARLAVVWGVGFVVGGWWWAVNLLRYGTLQPAGIPLSGLRALVNDRPRSSVWEYAGIFFDKITATFWGTFGQLELGLPMPLVWVATGLLLLGIVLSLRVKAVRLPLLTLLAFFALMLVALFLTTYLSHLEFGRYGGIQGRYLFGGLVAVLAAVAIGIGGLVRPGTRADRLLPAAAFAVTACMAAFALWVAFRGYYLDIDWSLGSAWARMIAWSPWPTWAVDALAVGIVLWTSALFLFALVRGLRGTDDGGAGGEPGVDAEDEEPAAERGELTTAGRGFAARWGRSRRAGAPA